MDGQGGRVCWVEVVMVVQKHAVVRSAARRGPAMSNKNLQNQRGEMIQLLQQASINALRGIRGLTERFGRAIA